MKRRIVYVLFVGTLILIVILSLAYFGSIRHQRFVRTLIGNNQWEVLHILGEPDRVDNAVEFNDLQKGMLKDDMPLYPKYIAANGPVWQYNRTSTRRLTLFFSPKGRVERIISTLWPSLPGKSNHTVVREKRKRIMHEIEEK